MIKKGKHFLFFRLHSFSQITVSLSFQKQLEVEQFISVEQEHFSGTKHFYGPINFKYFFFLYYFLYVFIFFFV